MYLLVNFLQRYVKCLQSIIMNYFRRMTGRTQVLFYCHSSGVMLAFKFWPATWSKHTAPNTFSWYRIYLIVAPVPAYHLQSHKQVLQEQSYAELFTDFVKDFFCPPVHVMLGTWFPNEERTALNAFVFADKWQYKKLFTKYMDVHFRNLYCNSLLFFDNRIRVGKLVGLDLVFLHFGFFV